MIKRYFEEAHIERCKGSVSDNVNYVKKTGKWENDDSKQEKKIEGTFEEYGRQPPDSKGKRSDMSELYQMVIDNMTNNIKPEMIGEKRYVRMAEGAKRYSVGLNTFRNMAAEAHAIIHVFRKRTHRRIWSSIIELMRVRKMNPTIFRI